MSKDIVRDAIRAEIVRLLVEERKRRRISGNALAEKAGLSQALISSLETTSWNPTLNTLLRIGDALQLDIGALITVARKTVLKKQTQ